MAPSKKRETDIDLIKAIAIIGVVIIHTCIGSYIKPIGSFDFISGVFWGALVRGSVPLFFMCSGALMLKPERELTLKRLYLHNILRLLGALLFWAAVYALYHLIVGGSGIAKAGIIKALEDIILFKHEFHLYYLHITLLLYAFLPIVRLIVKGADKKALIYCLGLWFLLAVLYPTLKPLKPFSLLSGIPAQWLMNMTYGSMGYALLGYYLKKYPLPLKASLVMASIGFVSVFGGTLILSCIKGELYTGFFEGMFAGNVFLAAGVFNICQKAAYRLRGFWLRFIAFLSEASFCVYLVHVFFIYILPAVGLSVNILPCIISIPLTAAVNIAVCLLIYLVLKKLRIKWII